MTVPEHLTTRPAGIYPDFVCLHTMQRCAHTQIMSMPAVLQTYRIDPHLTPRIASIPLETKDSSLPGSQWANWKRLKAHR